MPVRRVPVAMKEKLKRELNQLEKRGIIAKVDTPTDWVSSLVVVKKANGKLRICIDPKPLNKALKRSHYLLPVVEDLLPELSNAKVFSKCDVKNAFWHVVLDEKSSYLTTFETPFARYRWLKMPFGISPAPEYFQQFLEQNLTGLSGIKAIADDIIIYGKGETYEEALRDHDNNMQKLLERCQERGIKLNRDKFQLHKTEMQFVGHLLTDKGVQADPSKIEAITKMPKPTDKKAVQRLLGLVNYLAKFLDKLSEMCEPLRQLTRKDVVFNWTHEHDEAFDTIKQSVCNAPVLRYYDSKLETVIQCVSSESGLGATLLQEGQPVAYASRALTQTEQNYAQIEKELLAVVFAFEKFHHFTYGRRVFVESDHKPLEIISKKPLFRAPKRLQRMLLKLQTYDYEICYKKGKHMYISDTLSRAYIANGCATHLEDVLLTDYEKEIEATCSSDYLAVSSERQTRIKQATLEDQTLVKLIECIKNGWNKAPREVKPYYSVRDELSVDNGIIFRGDRCIIPKSMRREILDQLHSHIGIEGCLKRARSCVYWPNITSQIKDFISKCDTCQSLERKQSKEPLISHSIPDRPWAKVGTDVFTFDGNDYLVTVDYFSNFFEIDRLYETTSKEIVAKLKQHFAMHGIPERVISDNASVYKSEKFKSFSRKWDFTHVTSSARYPQSNGKAENAVKTAKRIMKKAKHSHTDPMLALLNFRNTPQQATSYSPAQQLMNRKTRTLLPERSNQFQPSIPSNVKAKLQKSKDRQAYYYNRTAKPLDCLRAGDTVRIQPNERNKTWEKGTVVEKPQTRSYNVLRENGTVVNRNRKHLRRTSELFNEQREETVEIDPKINDQELLPQTDSRTETELKPQTIGQSVNSETPATPVTQTRSGRIVRMPLKYKDYHLTDKR
ncbi:uncharacterized protein K02A2.6-like [Mercenaria mercenaria]|uniref:uncharacterized protein K02A2.6-like n=1 Tax=Mercenaria mercenaria TaxID=6596 RepID=UPI00234F94B2|nr:uncharacterized protein K02A2.6-like [Mercenaria mercenaria]